MEILQPSQVIFSSWTLTLIFFSFVLNKISIVFLFVPGAFCAFAGHHWEESGSILHLPIIAFIPTIKISPRSLLFFSLNSPNTHPLLLWETLKCLIVFVQYAHVSFVLGSPELDSALQTCIRPGWKRRTTRLDLLEFLCWLKGSLLTSAQLNVHWDPKVFLFLGSSTNFNPTITYIVCISSSKPLLLSR